MIMLDAIQEVLTKREIDHIRIDGKTKQASRLDLVDRFRLNPETCKFAVLGIQAASTGLNLTPCANMVFCELNWVPATLMQAEDRIHRT